MTAWDWDLKTGTVVSSAMTRDIFGVDGVTGDVFLQMVHPEDRSRMQETIRRALVKEHSYSLEFRIVRPDGTLRWVHSRGVAEVDSAGRPLRMIGIASDITGQRRVSARLAAEHAIARTLATACSLEEAAPAIVGALVESFDAELGALWLVDPDADRLRCAAVPSHGASSSLREFADRCGELSCGRGEGLPGRVWATGEWAWSADLQADAHLAQGTTTVNPGLRSALAFPIHVDGHLAGVIEIFCAHNLEPDETMLGSMKAIANDISQFLRRRRAEDEVARLNRDLRHRIDEMQTLFDVAPVGIAVAEDPGCNVIRANPACASILGIANEVNASKSGRDAHRLPFRVMKDGREVPVEALPMQYAAAAGVGLHEGRARHRARGRKSRSSVRVRISSPRRAGQHPRLPRRLRRHHRAQARRGCASRGGAAQGRISRHPRARASQPTGANPQLPRRIAPRQRHPGEPERPAL